MNNLLTAEQVCEVLNVKKSYLYHLTHNNKIPHIKIGNHLRFDEQDLNHFIEERKNGRLQEEQ